MNPYQHKSITNNLDRRLVDCFVKRNCKNDWLVLNDIASWVYERKQPTEQQKSYVFYKLISILGMHGTDDSNRSFLQRGYVTSDGEEQFAFRLKNPEFFFGMIKLEHSAKPGINRRYESARAAQLA